MINFTMETVRSNSLLEQKTLEEIYNEITTSEALKKFTKTYTIKSKTASKKELNELKRTVGYITVSNYTNNRRVKAEAISASYLFIDIDDIEGDIYTSLFKSLTELEYIKLAYKSPSGNIKAVIELTQPIADDILYTELYKVILNKIQSDLPGYVDNVKFDPKNNDMARIAFLSYDPNAYYNSEATINTATYATAIYKQVEKRKVERTKAVAEANTFLQSVPNKKLLITVLTHYIPAYANKIYKETPQEEHRTIWLKAIQGLASLGEEARVGAHAFNSNDYYNDSEDETNTVFDYELAACSNKLTQGKSIVTFRSLIYNIDKVLDVSISKKTLEIKWDLDISKYDELFFTRSDKGAIKIDNYQFGLFLSKNNIFSTDGYIVLIEDNIAKLYSPRLDFSFIRNYVAEKVKDVFLNRKSKVLKNVLSELFSGNGLLLNPSKLFNATNDINHNRFYKPYGSVFIVGENVITLYPKLKIESINIIDKFIWHKHILEYDIDIPRLKKYIKNEVSISTIPFNQFLIRAHGENYPALITKLGEMLYLDKEKINKILALYDAGSDSTGGDGGGGKSLTINFLGNFRKMTTIDKNAMNYEAKWMLSMITPDTDIVNFNDVPKNFNYELFYPLSDESMTKSTKGKDIVLIPRSDIPKVGLSTNHLPKDQSGAFKRRSHESILTSYYRDLAQARRSNGLDDSETVEKDIGRRLFGDKEDWTSLLYFVYHCIKEYKEKEVLNPINSLYAHKLLEELTDNTFTYLIGEYIINIAGDKDGCKLFFKPEFDRYVETYLQGKRDRYEIKQLLRNTLMHLKVFCDNNNYKMDSNSFRTMRKGSTVNKGLLVELNT